MLAGPGTTREELERMLLEHVHNNTNNTPPFTEEEARRIVHVEYDEIDPEKEFLELFLSEDVAIYLSELLDEEDSRDYLEALAFCPGTVPHIMLAEWRPDNIPDISMEEVLDKIRQIYKDNSMTGLEVIAEQAQKVAAARDKSHAESKAICEQLPKPIPPELVRKMMKLAKQHAEHNDQKK